MKFSLQRAAAQYANVQVLANTGDDGLELEPIGVRTGRNGGYQAINLALHLGAARILLLGYDMKAKDLASSHWFGAHPDQQISPYPSFLPYFAALAPLVARLGVEVINCSRATALTMFPRMPIAAALEAR